MSAFGRYVKGLWNHPAGPKTVFFWAPTMKWVLVIAGVKDMSRPVERVSLPQSAALATTGVIWARYSMVITPVNYNLGLVNLFVGATGLYQVVRVVRARGIFRRSDETAGITTEASRPA
mmetsp:Transcript_368/g.623  ORF Transcript_368/g.623 Transcript_368/m.623 type:complete len:119 (+) Transcript_368:5391-5747(+)